MRGQAAKLVQTIIALLCALAFTMSAAAAEIILYSSPNFQGKSLRVTGDVPSLRTYRFNDEVSSVVVISGEWALYEDANYQGRGVRVPPGTYATMSAVLMDNNALSSLRPIAPAAPPPPEKPKLPDLTSSIEARSGFLGNPSAPDSISFRGVTAFVTVTNLGEGRAAASTLAITAGPADLAPYRAAGLNPCPRGEAPWPGQDGGAATCARMRAGDILARPSGSALTCAIPALEPGGSVRCAGTFTMMYTWLVPPNTGWTITAIADSARKIRESDERNNGAASPATIPPDSLPAL